MSININILSNFNGAGFSKLERELSRLQTPMEKIGATARALGPMATIGFGALTALSVKAVNSASDMVEAQTAVNQIFGKSTAEIIKFSESGAKALGQSQTQILDGAKSFGIFGKAAGLAGEDNAKFSKDLIKLAADLASFNNTSVDEALTALGAGLRGESEPLRRFGVLLNDAELKAQAMKMGIYDGNGALSSQQKILAANAAIFEQTATQQGDFARTSDGLANSQRILTAQMENLSAKVGNALLPVFEAVVPLITGLLTYMEENTGVVIALAAVFGTLAVAIIAVNVAMYANPISLIIAGVALLITGVILLVNWLVKLAGGWDVVTKNFMDGLKAVGSFFKTTWDGIASFFTTVFGAIGNTFSTGFKAMETGLKNFGSFFATIWNGIGSVAKAIMNGVLNTIEGFINFVIGGINGLINTINTVLSAGTVVGINFQLGNIPRVNIPALAEGGIVMPRPGGVLAQIAEAGQPEAVIPLDKLGSMNGGNTFNITVNAGMGANGTSIGRDIVDEILRFERSSGKVFARA